MNIQEAVGKVSLENPKHLFVTFGCICTLDNLTKLGFKFENVCHSYASRVIFPDGWSSKKIDSSHFYLRDPKRRKRVLIEYNPPEPFYNPELTQIVHIHPPITFYKIDIIPYIKYSDCRVVVKNYFGKTIKEIGSYTPDFESPYPLLRRASNWLDDNFPGWEDPTNFWD